MKIFSYDSPLPSLIALVAFAVIVLEWIGKGAL